MNNAIESQINAIGITLKIAVLSVFQSVIFIFVCEAAFELYTGYVAPMNEIYGFGVQMSWSTSLLAILCGINSIGQILTSGAWIKLSFLFATSLVWILYWTNIAGVVPNRFLLLSIAGLISFGLGAFVCERHFQFRDPILEQIDLEGVK